MNVICLKGHKSNIHAVAFSSNSLLVSTVVFTYCKVINVIYSSTIELIKLKVGKSNKSNILSKIPSYDILCRANRNSD